MFYFSQQLNARTWQYNGAHVHPDVQFIQLRDGQQAAAAVSAVAAQKTPRSLHSSPGKIIVLKTLSLYINVLMCFFGNSL